MLFDQAASRRQFLKFLSASPLLAGSSALACEGPAAGVKLPDPIMWAPLRTEALIKSPKEAINVFDFEPVARVNIPPAHFGYMASGIDDEVTLRANRADFLKLQLRPRRLVDVSKVDMSIDLLGAKYPTPIIIAPVGGQHRSTLTAKSRWPRRHAPAITCRSSRLRPTSASKRSPPHVARRSGISSTPPTNGTSRKRWCSARKMPAAR